MLTKRTPGTPLSEAELQQRRDAARARWEGAAALAGGAVGAGIGAGVASRVGQTLGRWVQEDGQREAGAAMARAERRIARHEAAARRQSRNAGNPWPMAPYARAKGREARLATQEIERLQPKLPTEERKGRRRVRRGMADEDAALRLAVQMREPVTLPPGPLYNKARRRLRELEDLREIQAKGLTTRALLRRFPSEESLTSAIRRAETRFDAALPRQAITREPAIREPRPQAANPIRQQWEAAVARRARAQDHRLRAQTLIGKPVKDEDLRWRIAGADGRPKPLRAQGPVEPRLWADAPYEVGAAPPQRRRTRAWPSTDDLSAMRREMRAGLADRVIAFSQAEAARGRAKASAILASTHDQVQRIARNTSRARIAGGVAGAGLGSLAAYLAARPKREEMEKAAPAPLAKVAPRALTNDLATRLGALFRAWTENPAQAASQEAVQEAVAPAEDLFLDAADRIIQPPGGDGTQSAPTGPDPRYLIQAGFDARNPRVEQLLRTYSFDLIRNITDQSREAVRVAMQLGAITGATIPEQARLIRQSVGLSPGQVGWVASYRAQLETLDPRVLTRALRDARFDRTIQRAIQTGERLSPEQVDRMVDAYHRRTLAYRATTIARTEGIRAANKGSIAQVKAMLEADPTLTVEKTWIATDDERTRHSHQKLNRQVVVGLETPFMVQGEDGAMISIRYPHDEMAPASETVNCRCTMGFRVIRAPAAQRLVAEAV